MVINTSKIELNEQFNRALAVMEGTTRSIFITGRAGTGKSTLLSYFRDTTAKQIAVLAPTGVAALNIKGQTIHSFFKFRPSITLEQVRKVRASSGRKNIYEKLESGVPPKKDTSCDVTLESEKWGYIW